MTFIHCLSKTHLSALYGQLQPIELEALKSSEDTDVLGHFAESWFAFLCLHTYVDAQMQENIYTYVLCYANKFIVPGMLIELYAVYISEQNWKILSPKSIYC